MSIIFSKKLQLKLLYFILALMLFLHSFQGFQGWNHERNEDTIYCTQYSELDNFLTYLIRNINYGTSTSAVLSLDIILNQISNNIDSSSTLFNLQSLINNQITHFTSTLLVNGEIFRLGGTTYSVLILIGKISLEKLKYTETKKQLLRNKNMVIIKETINENPGINLREIQRSTDLAMGVIQYHIRSLESEECEIESLRFGRSKHFFSSSAGFSIEQKLWFSLSRNQNIKNILELLVSEGQYSQKDLSRFTGNSKSLISYYIKVLRLNGIIEVENHHLRISEDFIKINRDSLHEKT